MLEFAAQFDRKIIIEARHPRPRIRMQRWAMTNRLPRFPVRFCRRAHDYEDKHLLNKAQTVLPANLEPAQIAEIQRLAVECYQAVDCEGMARVDFLMEGATGKFFINEINTIPGFTSIKA